MSLSVFLSGNLHRLLNNLGRNSAMKFLKLQYCSCKQFHVWRCSLQNSALANEARLGLQTSIATCSSPLSTLQNQLVSVRAWSNNTACVRKAIDWPATILVFDIETTGFSKINDRIIEIAFRDLIGGKDSTFETLVNPGEKYISNAHVHGIRNYMVNRPDVPMFSELAPIVLQYVQSRKMPGKPVILVAHNGHTFDVPFIISEFKRCSMNIPEDWVVIDTRILARGLVMPDGSKLRSISLTSLCEHYGISLVGPSHRAMQDVTKLCHVFQRITFDLKLTVSQLLDLALRPKRD